MLCPSTKNTESVKNNNGSLQPTEFGRWLQVTKSEFERGNGNRWVHEKCALFSEDIYQVDGMVDNVHRVIARSSNRICAGCHQKGATVRCWSHSNNCDRTRPVAVDARGRNNDSCNALYHYKCAVQHGCVFVEDGYRMFCPQHKDDAPRIDDVTFMQALSEPADEASIRHDDYCYICRTGGRLLMCDTCSRTTHPACSGLRRIPIGDWSCSVCTGSSPPHRPLSSGGVSLSSKRLSGSCTGKVIGSRGKRARASEDDYLVIESEVGHLPGEGVGTGDGGTSTTKRSRRGSTASDVSVGTANPNGAGGMKRLVVAATGLNDAQKETFATLTKACRVTVKDDVEDRVTHVVIGALESHDKPTRTMKLCKAVARRLPILQWPWVSTSIANGRLVDTTDYVHSVTRDETEAAVFYGRVFSFSTFSGDKQKRAELSELIKLGGGTIASSESQIFEGVVFVRNEDGVQQRRQSRGKSRFEPPDGATVVPYTWILDQITQRSNGHS